MTTKDKLILVFLSIITLGIYLIFVFKKKESNISSELSQINKLTINVKKLLEFIGGNENILGVEYTQTKVKIFIKDHEKVLINELQKLKNISGVFKNTKNVTIIVGKQAKELANQISK